MTNGQIEWLLKLLNFVQEFLTFSFDTVKSQSRKKSVRLNILR